ncbi:MAG: pilus assembly protein CpaB [Clostridia bacterium]|nr:pilus assembly protein CpaB [Clostridia bacterium]
MRNKLVFIVAIIFGLTTSFLVYNYLNKAKQSIYNTEYVNIVVAAQDIPAKTVLKKNMLSLKKIPKKYMHIKETSDFEDVVDKILLVPVTAGESIMTNQLLNPKSTKEGLAYIVPIGKRALTIPVDEVSGVAGLIKPGDRVDVIATVVIDDEPFTLILLQDVEVLAVGKLMDINTEGSKKPIENNTVTLAVTHAEAKPLMLASQRGAIRLMLRSPLDDTQGYTPAIKMNDLIKYNDGSGYYWKQLEY